ncbi:DUF1684 domain-containing protein [Catalinimonas niigatensis]|uniref:DUF1684 domain-containing protein n=1 Tax=Catalinimonas niigatensis TaxID=1397264 RepID=UPI002665D6A0|nr:DUF1684 domain-containing protein [Catalinimonas niigatensis]WPP49348.1 DUF1684 domain-containing protein [Catalinimonas niigatensis]
MKKKLLATVFILVKFTLLQAQSSETYEKEIIAFQHELNEEYADPQKSPLKPEALSSFTALPFFPVDEKYRLEAKFVRTPNSKPFRMKTSGIKRPIYEKYGEVHFELQGETYQLNVYQNHELRETEAYQDYLFIPFTDLSSADETYGGGRYLDLRIPEGDSLVIDFNKAYNPYCAYNEKYSCPIPPQENNLPITIRAGVKME